MRILFATDLHGSTLVLRKALKAVEQYDADVFLLGGDLSGKYLLPVVFDGDYAEIFEPLPKREPKLSTDSFNRKQEVLFRARPIKRDGLTFHLQRLEAKGYYWHECKSRDEAAELTRDAARYSQLEQEYICERLGNWADAVNEKLGEGRVCYWTGGNDDDPKMLERFRERNNGVFQYAEGKCVTIDDSINLISLGVSNRTPFDTAREMDEDDLLRVLRDIYGTGDPSKNLLLNVHVPPAECGNLDLCDVEAKRKHVGSFGVRTFIEQVQPIADFAGHVHEGKGVGRIGRTFVFNPGSDWNAGVLQAFVVVVAGNEIVDYTHLTE